MPDVTTLVIVGAAWAALLVLVWAMCVASARGDGQDDRLSAQDTARRPTVVADTGAIRDHLQDGLRVMKAEQLTVTVDMDGRDAVLASARSVVEARQGDWPKLAVPVRLGGRNVAMLRAARRPGERRFDAEDMMLLQGVAERVSAAMLTAHPSTSVPADSPSAMA